MGRRQVWIKKKLKLTKLRLLWTRHILLQQAEKIGESTRARNNNTGAPNQPGEQVIKWQGLVQEYFTAVQM